MRTRIAQLGETANTHGEATASNGRWWAYRYDSETDDHSHVVVGHYSTAMIALHYDGHDTAQRVSPIDEGHRSMTDKCGIGAIVRHEGVAESYADVFDREVAA